MSPSKRQQYLWTPYLFSYSYTDKAHSSPAIPFPKSFRRDILRGYLQNTPFVFSCLARKREICDIYPI